MKDPIVESLKKDFDTRSKLGIEKYGTTLQENNQDDFLQHALEEAMDLCLYLKKLIVLRDEKKAEGLVSLGKKYKTRSGRDVRLTEIIDSPHGSSYPVIGFVCTGVGDWSCITWNMKGEFNINYPYNSNDLIEVIE